MTREIDGIGDFVAGATVAALPAASPRVVDRFRIPIAFAALVAWLLITGFSPFHGKVSGNFMAELTGGPQWGILCAGLFLVLLTALCRWRDLGFGTRIELKSLLMLWLPAIYLALFLVLDVAVIVVLGPPSLAVAGFLLLNAMLAAFSEELMFRGVLFGALRTRLRPLWAIVITTVLFGMAHLLNAVALGNFQVAAAQAVAAGMSGLLFIAIRVRTGSIVPGMVYHALWDFGTLLLVAQAMADPGNGAATANLAAGNTPPVLLLAPALFLLPNFLYALFLLRRRKPAA